MTEQKERLNVKAAYGEVFKVKNFPAKALIYFLINLIPALNRVIPGAAIQWGKKVGYDPRAQPPANPFADNGFPMGVYHTVYLAFWCIVFVILLAIPVVGWAIFIVLVPCVFVGIIRMAFLDTFRLEFRTLWKVYRRGMKDAMIAVWPPALLFIACLVLAFLFIFVIGKVPLIWLVSDRASLITDGGLVWVILACVVLAFGSEFSSLFIYRALGAWAAIYAPEWIEEAQSYGLCQPPSESEDEEEQGEDEGEENEAPKHSRHAKHAAPGFSLADLDDEDEEAEEEPSGEDEEGPESEEPESEEPGPSAEEEPDVDSEDEEEPSGEVVEDELDGDIPFDDDDEDKAVDDSEEPSDDDESDDDPDDPSEGLDGEAVEEEEPSGEDAD